MQMEIRTRWEAEFASSHHKDDVNGACIAWCALLAERTGQRCFSSDPFVINGLHFARDRFSQITEPRLATRVAIWICAIGSIIYSGDPQIEHWEAVAFEMAEKSGSAADSVSMGVVAAGRRVWQGVPMGRFALHRQRLDALTTQDSVSCQVAIAWLAARAHCDLMFEREIGNAAQVAKLSQFLERAGREGIDTHATPIASAEFIQNLSSGKVSEARTFLYRTAHLAHRLAPYDAWLFWFYRTSLNLAAGETDAATIDAGRTLAFARQSGVSHTMFWAKLAMVRTLGFAPARSGLWRCLADARREARTMHSEFLVALCRMAASLVAAKRGQASRAAVLGRAALRDIEAVQVLRPPLFTAADIGLVLRIADGAGHKPVSVPMLRSLYAPGRSESSVARISSSQRVEIRCLGTFSITRNGRTLVWPRKAPRRPLDVLKATIACGRDGALVTELTDTLWPDIDGDRAHRAFGTALYRLRGLIGDDTLELSAGRLKLNRSHAWVDAYEFEEAAVDAGRRDTTHERLLLSLYGGPFLPDQMQDPWAIATRGRLRELLRITVRKTAERFLAAGHWHDALDILEEALKRDPLSEIFYQHAISACSAGGLRAEASAYYERCRSSLAEHLGINPSATTESLYRKVLRAKRKK